MVRCDVPVAVEGNTDFRMRSLSLPYLHDSQNLSAHTTVSSGSTALQALK